MQQTPWTHAEFASSFDSFWSIAKNKQANAGNAIPLQIQIFIREVSK